MHQSWWKWWNFFSIFFWRQNKQKKNPIYWLLNMSLIIFFLLNVILKIEKEWMKKINEIRHNEINHHHHHHHYHYFASFGTNLKHKWHDMTFGLVLFGKKNFYRKKRSRLFPMMVGVRVCVCWFDWFNYIFFLHLTFRYILLLYVDIYYHMTNSSSSFMLIVLIREYIREWIFDNSNFSVLFSNLNLNSQFFCLFFNATIHEQTREEKK